MSEFKELCDKHGFSIKVSEGGVWRFYPTLPDLLDRVESQLGWDTYQFGTYDDFYFFYDKEGLERGRGETKELAVLKALIEKEED